MNLVTPTLRLPTVLRRWSWCCFYFVCFVIFTAAGRFMLSLYLFFVVVFFSPFSIVTTSLEDERAGLCASRASVLFFVLFCFARVDICISPLPLGVGGWLRLVSVALSGLSNNFCAGVRHHVEKKIKLKKVFYYYKLVKYRRILIN